MGGWRDAMEWGIGTRAERGGMDRGVKWALCVGVRGALALHSKRRCARLGRSSRGRRDTACPVRASVTTIDGAGLLIRLVAPRSARLVDAAT